MVVTPVLIFEFDQFAPLNGVLDIELRELRDTDAGPGGRQERGAVLADPVA